MVSKSRLSSTNSLQTQFFNTEPPGSPFDHDRSSGTPTYGLLDLHFHHIPKPAVRPPVVKGDIGSWVAEHT